MPSMNILQLVKPESVADRYCNKGIRGHLFALFVLFGVLFSLPLLLIGCDSSSANGSPEHVLSQFLEAMDRSSNDIDALQEAYGLLDSKAREGLKARALKAETLTGRSFEPWKMLAQGRFRLRFLPAQRKGMRAEIKGNRAIVIVTGTKSEQRAEVPMVREKDGWKLELPIPEI